MSPPHTPRPIPQFFDENNHLATKKKRFSSTPKPKLPPRPPSKSVTQYSRLSFSFINPQQQNSKAQIISYKYDDPPKLSPLYDRSCKKSYLKQCYNVEEKIGSGSFGDVFRVKNRWDNKYYAVKVSREKFKGKIDREEKLNEVFKHEQLPNHDHLIKLHYAWEEKQRLYIETELCAGTLSTLAENNRIPENLVWSYLVDLLKALDHLHSNNLIHLDVKPENIFISRDGICKLGDFGLIFDISNHDLKEAIEGDPKYLAGEIMQGAFTKAADIFSLGMTILEIAFDLDLPSRGEAWHMFRDCKIPEHLFENKSDLRTILMMMLDPDYKKRPTAHELLNHPIIKKHERRRRFELRHRKILTIIRDKIQSLNDYFNDANMVSKFAWFLLKNFLNILSLPLRFIWNFFFINSENSLRDSYQNIINNNSGDKSINYNRVYVSNYLDQYSEDEDVDMTRFGSNYSFDRSFSNDEENLPDAKYQRNLCSTVDRNVNVQFPLITPKISPFEQNNSLNPFSDSIVKRLKFDEYSSDEMELTENEEGGNNEQIKRSMISSSNLNDSPKTSGTRVRSKKTIFSTGKPSDHNSITNFNNIPRKNLMRTFDEIEDLNT